MRLCYKLYQFGRCHRHGVHCFVWNLRKSQASTEGFGVVAVWLSLRVDSQEVCAGGPAAVLPGVLQLLGAQRAWYRCLSSRGEDSFRASAMDGSRIWSTPTSHRRRSSRECERKWKLHLLMTPPFVLGSRYGSRPWHAATTYSHTLKASVAKLKCLAIIVLTGKEAGCDLY